MHGLQAALHRINAGRDADLGLTTSKLRPEAHTAQATAPAVGLKIAADCLSLRGAARPRVAAAAGVLTCSPAIRYVIWRPPARIGTNPALGAVDRGRHQPYGIDAL